MDEAIDDEVVELIDGTHTHHKDIEFSIKPGSSNLLQPNEMAMPVHFAENSKNCYPDILNTKDIDRIGSSEHASVSPRCMDAAGIVVEELTLRNCDGNKRSIVGASGNKEQMQTKPNPWQNLYQIAGGSGIGNVRGQTGNKAKGLVDGDNNLVSGLLENSSNNDMNNLLSNDKGTSGDILRSSGGIRSRITSKSGFSEYFIKNRLRGKELLHKNQVFRGFGTESFDRDHPKSGFSSENFVAPFGSTAMPSLPLSNGFVEPQDTPNPKIVVNGFSLREWMEVGGKKADKVEKMYIFKKILDLVNYSHSHGISLQELRPSYFKLSESHQVVYLGSSVDSGIPENVDRDKIEHHWNEKRPMQQTMLPLDNRKKRKFTDSMKFNQKRPQFPSRSGVRSAFGTVPKIDNANRKSPNNDADEQKNPLPERRIKPKLFGCSVADSKQTFQASTSVNFVLEEKWYASPEMINENRCTFASNIYCLGVLLFELLGSFDSGRSRAAAMLDLHHRILPPSFLTENPMEAGFCLWLLHPEPSSRPTTREVLQSGFVSGIRESSGGDLLSIDEQDEEAELLWYFLRSINDKKQKDASNLMEQIRQIEADIQGVEKHRLKKPVDLASSPQEFVSEHGTHGIPAILDASVKVSTVSDAERKLTSNIRKLENAYIITRCNLKSLDSNFVCNRDSDLLKNSDNWNTIGKDSKYDFGDSLGGFFDGLCKYARYRNFKQQGVIRNAEFNNSVNVICSLSFDRDEEYLAAAGVSKKIKIFEFQALFNDSVDIHYPAIEMSNKSKLSCLCWNSYIKNYLASTDYDGVVKLWDAGTGEEFCHFMEHKQRAWSVDFSRFDPMKLVSGGDDRLVKIWSTNEKNSLCTIRNSANVCSVQFSGHSPHLLAVSSADYMTYCYDVRNVSRPWCILGGHEKAVSYSKFLDAATLVSASTDNTLKIWDLKRTSADCLSRDACISTLRGHSNEKNFVGLTVCDGYISCGSETNEVFAYYKSLPMPITAHKFGSLDAITGKETEDDNGQFVSSVCWRQKSNTVVAANSSGCIKLLDMV